MIPSAVKRTVDMQIIADWVEPRSRVLDLGCGRGVLLESLVQTKQIFAVGVDLEFDKITSCVRRGLTAYQGDMLAYMAAFPDAHFDRVICSRTLEEVPDPSAVIAEALRVGRVVTVGFVNHGYWKNRYDTLLHGRKPRNPVYPQPWHESSPATASPAAPSCAATGTPRAPSSPTSSPATPSTTSPSRSGLPQSSLTPP
jgi:methionine biosynthesis protein MetW